MTTKELSQKLIKKGWRSVPSMFVNYEDSNFYLWKKFRQPNRKSYKFYKIYPNQKRAQMCIWQKDNEQPIDYPWQVTWESIDYEIILYLTL